MNILIFKFLSIILIIIAAFIGGLIPLRSKNTDGKSKALLMGNSFAGGVFLGAGFLHMMPDAVDNFSQLNIKFDYPFALLIAALGFIFVLALEKVIAVKEESEIVNKDGSFPIILFIVLSVHSIIAGMSLGLESTFLSGIVIFIAIIAHKGSAAFALSVNMLEKHIKHKIIKKSIALLSIMTPLGIIIGGIIDNMESSMISVWFEAIFDSLAAGTFIYIAVMEIINEIFEEKNERFTIYGFLILGFFIMALIAIWT